MAERNCPAVRFATRTPSTERRIDLREGVCDSQRGVWAHRLPSRLPRIARAGLETRGTADLEVCATAKQALI